MSDYQDQNCSSTLAASSVKKAYLITYSNADTKAFNRETFSSAIVQSFESATTSAVIQWACCMEQHKNGSYHFHMAVLLERAQRWIRVKRRIQEAYDIIVNFSDHPGYYSAYRYVVKEDQAVLKSQNHPIIAVQPRTATATRARARQGRKGKQPKRLSNSEVANIVLKKKIHSRLHLLAHAKSMSRQGDNRLYDFLLNRSQKKVNELVDTVWEIETATEKVARSAMSRLQILQQQLTGACICNGEWLQCALDILAKNSIDRAVFSDAIITLLVMGRGKGRNIFICGPANCGKTFILDPLRVIFNAFLSPATCSYAWLGVEDKEVIFLNDFRWSPVILPWSDMLLLLEGHIVHFAAPKTTYNQDIEFSKDTPIFATSKAPISFIKGSMTDDRETEMMAVRWRTFKFRHQFDINCQRTVPSCGYCFATLVVQ